ncbi:hypothetical protein GCM10010246_53490 [Streptomyces cuspidosporus]|uniref:Uncharacterized protein n=1 Tax=Streptomyces cuspidosporus TaxID=66882 RepID=A0ABN3GPD6_9ACTN
MSFSSSQAILRLDTLRYKARALWSRPDGFDGSFPGCTFSRYPPGAGRGRTVFPSVAGR